MFKRVERKCISASKCNIRVDPSEVHNLRALFTIFTCLFETLEFWSETDHLLMRLQSAQLIQSGGINSLLLEMDTNLRNWRYKAGLGSRNQELMYFNTQWKNLK